MELTENQIITLTYTTSDESGKVLDSNANYQPMVIYSDPELFKKGLFSKIRGMKINEQRKVTLTPEEGFGMSRPENIFWIEKQELEGQDLEIGSGIITPAGLEGTIRSIEGSKVQVDSNHPFCDLNLVIDVFVNDLRPATEAERLCGMPLVEKKSSCCGPEGCC